MAEKDEKSGVLLTFSANHSQIAKPRAALILKNSLRNTPQGKPFAGSVQETCLTFSAVLCGGQPGACGQHGIILAYFSCFTVIMSQQKLHHFGINSFFFILIWSLLDCLETSISTASLSS